MNKRDRELGMACRISRRDLLHGAGALAAAGLAGPAMAGAAGAALAEDYYPPRLTGMRGNHPGSFDAAHPLAREGKTDWGPAEGQVEDYDLVVVGGGISGLSAAWFYRDEHPDARILVLDNHDDFGGHAKRNEFQVNGKHIIGYGGSQTMESFSGYSRVSKKLLGRLGVDFKRFFEAYDDRFFRKHGMGPGLWFDKAHWGVDRLVHWDIVEMGSYVPMASNAVDAATAVAQMPISEAARPQMLHLLTETENQIPDIEDNWWYLNTITYRQFLERHMGVTEDDVFRVLQNLALDSCVGIDAVSASTALGYAGLPGFFAAGLEVEDDDPYIAHFPDGNASVARLLVRQLIPGVAPGNTMDDVVGAAFDYSRLDRPDQNVRIRLNSTAVHAANLEDGSGVATDYMQGGVRHRVRSTHCILACYHSIIPWLAPELPEKQRKAMSQQVKAPILYTNVALRNWRAWKELGIAGVTAPDAYHNLAALDFPVSMGGYDYASGPDDPIVVHMEKFLHVNNQVLHPKEQRRLGRLQLYETSFETIEREIRSQLGAMLSPGGFDPAKDIAAITVNRWAHGYSYWPQAQAGDAVYEDRNDPRHDHVIARQPFGRIHIANCDAGARPWLPTSIEQAWRAVGEIG